MQLHTVNIVGDLTKKVNNFFNTFKNNILNELISSWKKESFTGKSYSQWSAFTYFKLLYLFIIIDNDVKRNLTKTWKYFEHKYNLLNIVKCSNCSIQFDYNKAKTAFGFNLIPNQPTNGTKSLYDLAFLTENPYICSDVLQDGNFDIRTHDNQDIFNLSNNGNNIIIIGIPDSSCNFNGIQDTIDNNGGDNFIDN